MLARRSLAGAMALLLPACGSLAPRTRSSSEQRPQANDAMTGTGGLMLTLARSTAVATVKQPVTTAKLGFSLFYQRTRELGRSNVPFVYSEGPIEGLPPGGEPFERLLDKRGIRRAEPGKVAFRPDGKAFFSDFDREVATARHNIDVQIFIFDNDDIGVRCADALRNRSAEVRVRVLFDDLGTTFSHASPPETPAPPGFTPPADIGAHLRNESHVKVRRTLNPWLVADHTKLLIFDQERAYLGGMNLGREYRSEWHDLMLRVEGPIVASLCREFSQAWHQAGPMGDLALLRKPSFFQRKPVGDGVPLRILRTDPAKGRYDVLKATLLAIRASQKRIWIENPYFAADDIEDELVAAARRGVDVRVILPSRGDSTIMDAGNLGTARNLLAAGAKVYRYPKMTHLKAMICDGWATVGSANLDMLSMRINRELNLAFNDPATVKALEDTIFRRDFRLSKPFPVSATNTPIAPIAETVADQL